ncbi:hypothetical protein OF83DRAFT_1086498 [Amylostereum chailletii]|nr:hypothetical protein OF83DRAFT_1086498 [Amylostereum chailletii]
MTALSACHAASSSSSPSSGLSSPPPSLVAPSSASTFSATATTFSYSTSLPLLPLLSPQYHIYSIALVLHPESESSPSTSPTSSVSVSPSTPLPASSTTLSQRDYSHYNIPTTSYNIDDKATTSTTRDKIRLSSPLGTSHKTDVHASVLNVFYPRPTERFLRRNSGGPPPFPGSQGHRLFISAFMLTSKTNVPALVKNQSHLPVSNVSPIHHHHPARLQFPAHIQAPPFTRLRHDVWCGLTGRAGAYAHPLVLRLQHLLQHPLPRYSYLRVRSTARGGRARPLVLNSLRETEYQSMPVVIRGGGTKIHRGAEVPRYIGGRRYRDTSGGGGTKIHRGVEVPRYIGRRRYQRYIGPYKVQRDDADALGAMRP